MAEYNHHQQPEEAVQLEESAPTPNYESTVSESERGLFESRKEEEDEKAGLQQEFVDKLLVSEFKPPHGHGVLHSSSEEEQKEEKMAGEQKEEEEDKLEEDTHVPVEIIHAEEEEVYLETSDQNSKLQPAGQHQEVVDDDMDCPPPTPAAAAVVEEEEGQQGKKGFLDKIKDKIPGFHSKPSPPQEPHLQA